MTETERLEREVAVPLKKLIEGAEAKAVDDHRRSLGLPRLRPAFVDCVWCTKEAIFVLEEREPIAWVLIEGCTEHRES